MWTVSLLRMCLSLPERGRCLNYSKLGGVLYATEIPFLGEAYNVCEVLHYMVESFSIMSWGVHFFAASSHYSANIAYVPRLRTQRCVLLLVSLLLKRKAVFSLDVGWLCSHLRRAEEGCVHLCKCSIQCMLFSCRIANETRLEVASGCACAKFVPCFCQAVSCCIDSFVVSPWLSFLLLLNSLLHWHLMSQVLHTKLPGVMTSEKKKIMASVAFFVLKLLEPEFFNTYELRNMTPA